MMRRGRKKSPNPESDFFRYCTLYLRCWNFRDRARDPFRACNPACDPWLLNTHLSGFLLFLWFSCANKTCKFKVGIIGFHFRNCSNLETVMLPGFYSFPGQAVWESRKHTSVNGTDFLTCQLENLNFIGR